MDFKSFFGSQNPFLNYGKFTKKPFQKEVEPIIKAKSLFDTEYNQSSENYKNEDPEKSSTEKKDKIDDAKVETLTLDFLCERVNKMQKEILYFWSYFYNKEKKQITRDFYSLWRIESPIEGANQMAVFSFCGDYNGICKTLREVEDTIQEHLKELKEEIEDNKPKKKGKNK
jgi:hypothetical protein